MLSTVLGRLVRDAPLVFTPPRASCRACIIVPARDEAQFIQATLGALAQQVNRLGRPLAWEQYEVILLANNCRDQTAHLARIFAQQLPGFSLHIIERVLPPAEAHVGRARQLLMDEAYRRLMTLGRPQGVICSTDADTLVAPDWLAMTLAEVEAGADGVGGRVQTDRCGRLALSPRARGFHLRDVAYQYLVSELETYLDPDPADPWPRHYQHFGASLAVTTQIYGKVGGLPSVRTPEDVALYQALQRVDARFRHSPRVRATTSARRLGRTENGLAAQLETWSELGQAQQPYLVESPVTIEQRLVLRRRLRTFWHQHGPDRELNDLAQVLGVDRTWLKATLTSSPSCGLFLQTVSQPTGSRLPVETAIELLRTRLAELRHNPLKEVQPIVRLAPSPQMLQALRQPQETLVDLISI
ncbi:glycosyltransferase [Candidatus Cyanaurora vandensis]|uniref:glycosyltransferase n=1 Tax=Candidatus Cyanaurora vandensis TaxID=2714958 RepID=UPI00257CF53D|nr:glycosyltransferase [Candidatus Cyanaurora vandensis]